MRLIDADALETHEQLEPMGNGQYEYVEVVYKDDIDDAPTIDAVEVVRCQECKYYTDAGTLPNKSCCGFCTKLGAVSYYGVDAMDFCSFGERGDENEID